MWIFFSGELLLKFDVNICNELITQIFPRLSRGHFFYILSFSERGLQNKQNNYGADIIQYDVYTEWPKKVSHYQMNKKNRSKWYQCLWMR